MSERRMCRGSWVYCDGLCGLCSNYTEQEAIDAWNTRYKYDYPLNYDKHYLDRLGRGDLNGGEEN